MILLKLAIKHLHFLDLNLAAGRIGFDGWHAQVRLSMVSVIYETRH